MGWTKRQYIMQAFDEIGLSSYAFSMTPDQVMSAARKLDAMMASWNAMGIRVSWPIPSSPDNTNIDDVLSVPDAANEAIFLQLALRLAPSYGKSVSVETKASARAAYDAMLAKYIVAYEMTLPSTMPVGAGNKPWNIDQPFYPVPQEELLVGGDGPLVY